MSKSERPQQIKLELEACEAEEKKLWEPICDRWATEEEQHLMIELNKRRYLLLEEYRQISLALRKRPHWLELQRLEQDQPSVK
jgi:hypothetical protein